MTGDSTNLFQTVTKTRLPVVNLAGVPAELPNTVLVWNIPSKRDTNTHHSIGTFSGQRLGNFVYFASLKMGGAVIDVNTAGSLVLDNNIILKVTNDTESSLSLLQKEAKI